MSDTTDFSDLLARAHALAEAAYAPYSKSHVGEIVVAQDGREFGGVNVENAAYGSTMCAEATAIGTAVAAGVHRIDTVAVATLEGTGHFPCGNCRQLMQEFGLTRVLAQSVGAGVGVHQLDELLPHGFGPDDLPDVGEVS
jgi:cytidine deaminase